MTEAEIRTAVHNLVKEYSTDTGALLGADNTLIDFFIDTAMDVVVIDLVEYCPEEFVTDEDVDLVADTATFTFSNTNWIQIRAAHKNEDDESKTPIQYIEQTDLDKFSYVGQTDADPLHFTRKGGTMVWLPTPSGAVTDYAKFWLILGDSMAESGPSLIPSIAHRLIPMMAANIILITFESTEANNIFRLYQYMLRKVGSLLRHRMQFQPQYLRRDPATHRSVREPTEYDPFSRGFFGSE
jgi:hypothetical protein